MATTVETGRRITKSWNFGTQPTPTNTRRVPDQEVSSLQVLCRFRTMDRRSRSRHLGKLFPVLYRRNGRPLRVNLRHGHRVLPFGDREIDRQGKTTRDPGKNPGRACRRIRGGVRKPGLSIPLGNATSCRIGGGQPCVTQSRGTRIDSTRF